MPEANGSSPAGEPVREALALQALLYAGGELDATETAAFERRLGEDQAAREALVQAVQMRLALRGQGPLLPDPAYRRRVRSRLLPRRPPWSGLLDRRSYRGHPALWCGLGAAAAVLLLALAAVPGRLAESWQASAPPAGEPRAVPGMADAAPRDSAVEVANLWADLNSSDHLVKAHDEEMRRRGRAEDRSLGHKGDERRARPLGNGKSRP
jgi:anti-sigma-K factor RskA